MEYRPLGRSGLKVSALCPGTMTFGSATDVETAERIVAAAREAGVNFIDTADIYCGFKSEQIVGQATKAGRNWWTVATKIGNATGRGPNDGGLSRSYVMRAVDASLRRLGGGV